MDDSATSRVKSNGVEDDDDGLTGDEETKLLGDGETRYCQGIEDLYASGNISWNLFNLVILLICWWLNRDVI